MDEKDFLFLKSQTALKSSKNCIEIEEYDLSVNRSYYACFYAAKALLMKKEIITKKHEGTIERFGYEYVVNGNFDREIAKIIKDLSNHRRNVDYIFSLECDKDDAIKDLEKAEKFVLECEKYLL